MFVFVPLPEICLCLCFAVCTHALLTCPFAAHQYALPAYFEPHTVFTMFWNYGVDFKLCVEERTTFKAKVCLAVYLCWLACVYACVSALSLSLSLSLLLFFSFFLVCLPVSFRARIFAALDAHALVCFPSVHGSSCPPLPTNAARDSSIRATLFAPQCPSPAQHAASSAT